MLPNRVHISKRATDHLKQIKSKTGVTPNILCRMALILSLDEGHKANPDSTDLNGSEFNLPTLLGDAGSLYEALIRQFHGDLSPKEAQLVLAAHIDNGVDKLKRVKSVSDLLQY
ncbi:MAG: DNA sulfur modification protein DndE [Dehalococcoidales bacterium]|nr:DNA sulfur modification protein DndE [Dehalococcoidales bacterium]